MKRLALALAVAALLGGGAFVWLVLASRKPVPVGLVDGRLRPCPATPNCVCSEGAAGDAAIAPLAFTGAPDAAFSSLLAAVASDPHARLERQEADYAHAVFRTPLVGFEDDLELRLDRAAGVVHVRSASRVGRSDLGANRARVEALRARWRP